jgi:hypothetical protein
MPAPSAVFTCSIAQDKVPSSSVPLSSATDTEVSAKSRELAILPIINTTLKEDFIKQTTPS